MSLPRSSLCFLLWALLAGGACTGGDETPFAKVLPSIAILEWESASPGEAAARPVHTTAVSVSLSDGRTVLLSSCVGLGGWRPAAVLVREGRDLSRLAVEQVGIDLSTGLAVVSCAWKPERAVSISEDVSPAVGERLYFVGTDPKAGVALAEGLACEGDIRQVGILRYERLTRTCCCVENVPSAAAAFDAQGRLFGFAVEAAWRTAVASRGQRYVNPVRAWIKELEELSRAGRVSRAWLGLTLRQQLDDAGKKAGAIVVEVLPESPAEKAGIVPGDLIDAWESDDVRRDVCCVTDLTFEIASMKPGTRVAVHFRRGGEEVTIPVSLEAMPESLTSEGEARTAPLRTGGAFSLQYVILAGTLEGVSKIIESAAHKGVILEPGVNPALPIRVQGEFAGGEALERAFLRSLEAGGLAYEASDSEIRIRKAGK